MRTARVAGVLAAATLLLGLLSAPGGAAEGTAEGTSGGAAGVGCAGRVRSDYNGDGYPDLAVGDPNARFREPGAGSVHLLLGTAEGFPAVHAADSHLTEARAPWAMRLTDVDGDGCADLVVGGPHAAEKRDRVMIFWGGRRFRPVFAQVGATPLAVDTAAGAALGWSVAAAEGVVAVGAPTEDVAGVSRAGAVYVFTVGPGRTVSRPIRITQEKAGVPGKAGSGDMFGWSLVLGRLGGDPDALDLAIGAPHEDIDGAGGRDAGTVTVLYDVTAGEPGGRLRGTRWSLPEAAPGVPGRAGDRFGYAVAYGEWRGKGYLAVSAPGAQVAGAAEAGMVRLFESAGDAGGEPAEPRPVRSLRQGAGQVPGRPEPGDGFGFSLAFAGGHLLVGSPFESVRNVPEAGAVVVVPLDGSRGSFVTQGRARVQAYDHFGWSVTGVGERWMAVGVPDERATRGGAVALVPIRGGEVHLLAPGHKGVPHLPDRRDGGSPRPHEIGESVDFGAVVAG